VCSVTILKMLKKIQTKLSWKIIEEDLTRVVNRFPLVVVSLFVLFGIGTILIHVNYDNSEILYAVFIKALMTALFVAILGYGLVLALESWSGLKKVWTRLLYVSVFLCGALYYLYIPVDIDNVPVQVIVTIAGLQVLALLGAFCARFKKQFFKKTYTDVLFYLFTLRQTFAALEGFFVAIFTFILGALTITSVNALFGSPISSEWYGQWWVFVATLVGPLYFLSHVPNEIKEKDLLFDSLKTFLHFVVLYIALPFIAIYFVILYVYSLQVLVNFSAWPEGVVSWLVILFSFFGWLIYFLSFSFKREKFVSLFRTWFPRVLVPQLGMLFYAIGLRIAQHGLTVNRSLVLVFGAWISFLCVYYIFSKKKALFVIPFSLFIGIVVILLGPWNIFTVSEDSQVNKLEGLFIEHDLLGDGSLVSLSEEEIEAIPESDKVSITSSVRYLCEYHGCDSMKYLFGIEATGIPEKRIIDFRNGTEFLSVYTDRDNTSFDVEGADIFGFVNSYSAETQNTQDNIVLEVQGDRVTLSSKGYVFDITQEVSNILISDGANRGPTKESYVIESVDRDASLVFLLSSANGQKNQEGVVSDVSLSGYAFVDYK